MKKKTGETKILSEIEQSALKELGAISTAVCLNALTELLSMTLIPSVPHFRYDYAKSIVGELFDEVKAESRFVVVVDSEFKESDSKVLGKFFIFPDEHAFEVIWKTLNLKQSNKESSGTKAE
jgi:chemotaxis protein CheC